MWYVGVEGRKIKAIKMSGSFGCINFFEFLKDLRSIIDNPKTVDSCVPCDPFTILFEMFSN